MHRVIEQGLEEYLEGSASPEFTAHIRDCETCHREVLAIQDTSMLFADLRSDAAFDASPSFTASVMMQIGNRRAVAAPSFWSVFSLDPTFGKRVVFASLLTLGIIGSYVVTQERDYAPGPTSLETVMASDADSIQNANLPSAVSTTTDGDRMLVKLTSYEP